MIIRKLYGKGLNYMKKVKRVNRLFLAMVLISIASQFLLGLIFNSLTLYQGSAISQVLFLIPVLCYILMDRGECLNELQLQVPRVSVLLLTMVFSWLLLPLMNWLNMFSMLFAENYVASGMMGLDGLAFGKNLLYIAIVPALAEEFWFRGIFYHGYRPAGVGKAILVSGLCFGLLHMNLNQFCYAFVLGMIFALLVEATGSVFCSILAHFIINANTVVMLVVESELEKMAGSVVSAAFQSAETLTRQDILSVMGFYTIEAVICCLLAYRVLRRIIRRSGRQEYMRQVFQRDGSPRVSIVSPALILGVVAAVVYMVAVEFLL